MKIQKLDLQQLFLIPMKSKLESREETKVFVKKEKKNSSLFHKITTGITEAPEFEFETPNIHATKITNKGTTISQQKQQKKLHSN